MPYVNGVWVDNSGLVPGTPRLIDEGPTVPDPTSVGSMDAPGGGYTTGPVMPMPPGVNPVGTIGRPYQPPMRPTPYQPPMQPPPYHRTGVPVGGWGPGTIVAPWNPNPRPGGPPMQGNPKGGQPTQPSRPLPGGGGIITGTTRPVPQPQRGAVQARNPGMGQPVGGGMGQNGGGVNPYGPRYNDMTQPVQFGTSQVVNRRY